MSEQKSPKVFISYCWATPGHCDSIRSYAERMVSDGVDITLDQWDLSEGQDKYAFMEQMVNDPEVTHVIIFSDRQYAERADKRKSGVGTESQIISREIYEKIDQRKFIPVVCERQADGEPYLPVFLKSRIWIDFSTPEAVNQNWEKLLRALYGKPIHQKPDIGKPPTYLMEGSSHPALPTIGKYQSLREALINSKSTVDFCRRDYVDVAISFADSLRIREQPDIGKLEDRLIGDLHTLLPLRDQLVDWLLLETSITNPPKLEKVLIDLLERVLALKFRPPEITSWKDSWFDAHCIFVYECFLYIIATLIRADTPELIHEILTCHYILPEAEVPRARDFVLFDEFYTYSQMLDNRNKRLNLRRLSPLADLIKERATHKDITFRDIMQAELLVFLVAELSGVCHWYPHTSVFTGRGGVRFPLFVRATQHKHFKRLQIITGINSADELRTRFKETCKNDKMPKLTFDADVSFWDVLNMDSLDTVK